ncbi:hypothetical protein M408DRAFT_10628 [Serendipita vermifera MAFF 305830]|uniref:Uncharacterized protein n=1 Tax=Serendipita vermifera MAFF 305830 TaxID=933852 RepID=A0A0C3AYP2_SERVB|nr:hypothetical protein M408DRAFT_10628 [Serendipita vermifera MAFF 305830]
MDWDIPVEIPQDFHFPVLKALQTKILDPLLVNFLAKWKMPLLAHLHLMSISSEETLPSLSPLVEGVGANLISLRISSAHAFIRLPDNIWEEVPRLEYLGRALIYPPLEWTQITLFKTGKLFPQSLNCTIGMTLLATSPTAGTKTTIHLMNIAANSAGYSEDSGTKTVLVEHLERFGQQGQYSSRKHNPKMRSNFEPLRPCRPTPYRARGLVPLYDQKITYH